MDETNTYVSPICYPPHFGSLNGHNNSQLRPKTSVGCIRSSLSAHSPNQDRSHTTSLWDSESKGCQHKYYKFLTSTVLLSELNIVVNFSVQEHWTKLVDQMPGISSMTLSRIKSIADSFEKWENILNGFLTVNTCWPV